MSFMIQAPTQGLIESMLLKLRFLTLVVSQRNVSQLQKEVSICIEEFFVFTTTANLFGTEISVAEIRQVSKICALITYVEKGPGLGAVS